MVFFQFVALGVVAGAGVEVDFFPNTGAQVSAWIEFVALGVRIGSNSVGAIVEAVTNTGVQVSKLIGFIISSAGAGVESGANGTIVSASLSTLQESSNSSFRAFSRGCN